MRLGQLARKLSLRPSQLVDFLALHTVQTEEGSNTRLADEHTHLIVQHFAPERLEEIMKPAIEELVPPVAEPVHIAETSVQVEPEKQTEATMIAEEGKVDEYQVEPEVIRVQKIELSGLKVLGKIDLPEPRKKEPKSEMEVLDDKQQKPERRPSTRSKHPRHPERERGQRNPIEVQRLREARELEEKRKQELSKEKEKRKHHYQNKVKQVKQPTRSKPAKATMQASNKPVSSRPIPKTWLGKFVRWWTT